MYLLKAELVKTFFGLALIAASSGYLAAVYIVSEENNLELSRKYSEKSGELLRTQKEKSGLAKTLDSEKAAGRSLEGQIGNLNDAVSTLQKYVDTDKQLLEKYSKVYFLNENYVPEALTPIEADYAYDKKKAIEFHLKAYPFLTRLLAQAKSEGMDLLVASAYRSFGEQSSLKSSYKTTFGASAANKFSADQGYSEHQLGTTADFTTAKVGGSLYGFEKTKEYLWLKDNAYKFGFSLSYPASNKYYVFEPWHWRFVGIGLATRLHTFNQYFYDMDQRDINDYLIQIFNPSL